MATEPTPEAYAHALRAIEGAAASDHNLPGVARWLVEQIEAQVRAKVAAEIRAESLGWCMDGIGRHLVENCAKIAIGRWEFRVVPTTMVPPDEIYLVPKRESDETYDDWVKRCAVIKIDPAARIAEGKGDETPGRCAHDLNAELTTFSDTDRRYRCSARGCGFEWTVPR